MAADDVGIYRRFQPSLWDSPEFMALPVEVKFLYLYLATGPCTTNLPGLFRFVPLDASAPFRLAMSIEDILRGVSILEEAGFVQYDRQTFVMWVVDGISWSPPMSPNVVKSWSRRLLALPSCAVKAAAMDAYLAVVTRLGGAFLQEYKQILSRQSLPQVRVKPTSVPSTPPAQANMSALADRPQVVETPPTTVTRKKVEEDPPPGKGSGYPSGNPSGNPSQNPSGNPSRTLSGALSEGVPKAEAVAGSETGTGAAVDIMSQTATGSGAVADSLPAAQQEELSVESEPSGTHRVPHNTATVIEAIVAIFKTDPLARAASDLDALAVARQCETWASSKGVPVQELPVIVQKVCEDLAAKQLLQSTYIEPWKHARWIVGGCRRAIGEFRGTGLPDDVAAARERRERARRVEEAKAREEAHERAKEANNRWYRENVDTVRGMLARVGSGGPPDYGPKPVATFVFEQTAESEHESDE